MEPSGRNQWQPVAMREPRSVLEPYRSGNGRSEGWRFTWGCSERRDEWFDEGDGVVHELAQ
jgi:hypothetical protein